MKKKKKQKAQKKTTQQHFHGVRVHAIQKKKCQFDSGLKRFKAYPICRSPKNSTSIKNAISERFLEAAVPRVDRQPLAQKKGGKKKQSENRRSKVFCHSIIN